MKKIFSISLAAFALVALSVSCNKEINNPDENLNPANPQEQVNPVAKTITITATLSDQLTKVSFDPIFGEGHKPTGMAHKWQEGDKLRVTDESDPTNTYDFDLISGAGTKEGVFSGDIADAASYAVEVIPAGSPSEGTTQTQAKDGDTAHLKYVATATGVTDLKAFSLDEASAIIGIIAKLPAGAADTVNALEIETSDDDFATSTTLTVNIATPGDIDGDNILKVYANVPVSWDIPDNSKMFLRFLTNDASHLVYTRYQEFASGASILQGKFNYIKMNCSHIDQFAGKDDDGTSAEPYLIADAYQLEALNALLAAKPSGTTVYAALIDDIDLDVIDKWVPIDASTRFINLEGNDMYISNLTFAGGEGYEDYYPGLFGILYGTVRNLTISKANISGGAKVAGILAGYLCSGSGYGIGCTVDNVTIEDSIINGNGKVCGALAGAIGQHASNAFAISISKVTVYNTSVTTTNDCGGLIALTQGATSANRTLSISDCDIINSTVSSTGTSIRVGGLVGFATSLNTTISDIDVKGTNVSGLSKAKAVGGIVGQVTSAVDFDRCTYQKYGPKTATVTGPAQHDGSTSTAGAFIGGIAGEVSGDATFDDCHVKNATVTFTTPSKNTNYWKYTGGAFGYIHSSGAKIGKTTACTVETVSVPAYHYCGGFVGDMNEGSIEKSTITGLTISGQNYVGGFIGQLEAGSISDCSVAGNTITSANATVGGFASIINTGSLVGCSTSLNVGDVSHKMATNLGGFAGQVLGGTLEDCHASGNVYATGNIVGGFAGYVSTGSFTSCHASGNISTTGNSVGGLLGKVVLGTVSECSATGNVTGNQYVGGIIGHVLPANDTAVTLSECYYSEGTVSASNYAGGLVGITYQGGDTGSLTITNCYMAGDVSVSGQWAGGILGSHYKGTATLENCYDTGSVTGQFGLGGIVGYVNATGLSVTRCFPFNSSISATNTDGEQHYSSGAVIGYGKGKALVVSLCYRVSDMASKFNDCSGNSANIIEQHSFIATAANIPQRKGLEYGYYHHGRNTAFSLCDLVHSGVIGEDWSNTIWDWSGSRPVLKNNKESL